MSFTLLAAATGMGRRLSIPTILFNTTQSLIQLPPFPAYPGPQARPGRLNSPALFIVHQQYGWMGGGRTPPNPSSEVDYYCPNTWRTAPPFATARRNFPTDTDGGGFYGTGHIWLAGGYGSDGMPLSSMEIYCNPVPTAND